MGEESAEYSALVEPAKMEEESAESAESSAPVEPEKMEEEPIVEKPMENPEDKDQADGYECAFG